MRVKRVGVMSLGLVMGALYGLFGLVGGAFMSLLALIGAGIGTAAGDEQALFGLIFGIGAVVLLPILYGVFGFVGGVITAFLYNLIAGLTGGIEIEFDTPPAAPAAAPAPAAGSPIL